VKSSSTVEQTIEKKRETFIEISDKIWEFAETRFEEYQSAHECPIPSDVNPSSLKQY
jgi:hypothetical protein